MQGLPTQSPAFKDLQKLPVVTRSRGKMKIQIASVNGCAIKLSAPPCFAQVNNLQMEKKVLSSSLQEALALSRMSM
jgi:hypothetical protein